MGRACSFAKVKGDFDAAGASWRTSHPKTNLARRGSLAGSVACCWTVTAELSASRRRRNLVPAQRHARRRWHEARVLEHMCDIRPTAARSNNGNDRPKPSEPLMARFKLMIERVLNYYRHGYDRRAAGLRYFNAGTRTRRAKWGSCAILRHVSSQSDDVAAGLHR